MSDVTNFYAKRKTLPNGNVVLPLYSIDKQAVTGYVVYGPNVNEPEAQRLATCRGPNALNDALRIACKP